MACKTASSTCRSGAAAFIVVSLRGWMESGATDEENSPGAERPRVKWRGLHRCVTEGGRDPACRDYFARTIRTGGRFLPLRASRSGNVRANMDCLRGVDRAGAELGDVGTNDGRPGYRTKNRSRGTRPGEAGSGSGPRDWVDCLPMTPRPLVLAAALLAAVVFASVRSRFAAAREACRRHDHRHRPGATLATGAPPSWRSPDVIALRFAIDRAAPPTTACSRDGCRIPSFAPETGGRAHRPFRSGPPRRCAPCRGARGTGSPGGLALDLCERAPRRRLQLADERLFVHRPAAWLEPLANTYIALVTYAPERADIAYEARAASGHGRRDAHGRCSPPRAT